MTAVVFIGPTLPGVWDAPPPGVELRPPAQRGDVLRALRDGATAIGLVDGLFRSVPSVQHKELLLAVEAGVPVLGAASMGALRAAECGGAGMVPVGRVATAYCDGDLVADDAVAVLHAGAEHGWRRMTEALVDVDDHVDAALAQELCGVATASALRSAARALHWADRHIEALLAAAAAEDGTPSELDSVGGLMRSRPGVKARDAALLLTRIVAPDLAAPRSRPSVPRTRHIVALLREVRKERHPYGRVVIPRAAAGGPGLRGERPTAPSAAATAATATEDGSGALSSAP